MDEAGKRLKAVIIAPRHPWPTWTGDRVRAILWIDALRPIADVTLVSPRGDWVPDGVTRVVARASLTHAVGAFVTALWQRLPLHFIAAGIFDWRAASREVERQNGESDVAVVLLSRTIPWTAGLFASRNSIVDVIDSDADSMSERARAACGPQRALWNMEAERSRRYERALGASKPRVLAINESSAAAIGERVGAVANGVAIEALGPRNLEYDFAFWGRLRYFANEDAVRRILLSIWPAIRRTLGDSKLLVAGADATSHQRRFDGRDGVRVISPALDRGALLRSVGVAIFPVRYGTGQLNKLLEAAEAGCAIVATRFAARSAPALAPAIVCAETDEEFAARAIEIASDRDRRSALGASARRLVSEHYSREASLRRLRDEVERPESVR